MSTQAARRVLVVDDDEMVRAVLSDVLDEEGFEIRAAANGREALDVLDTWRPDLILLDLMMPIMDGWAFREHQLARPEVADVPVIVLSARRDLADGIANLSAAAMVSKPFELETLLRVVAKAVA